MPVMRNALVAGGLVASLAGCAGSSGASGPVVKPPLQSRSPSPSPSPAAPAVPPPAALANTRDGASAFATFYIGVLSDAYQSNDVTDLRRFSDEGCGGCRNLIDLLERGRIKGDYLQGGTFTTLVAVSPPFDGDGTVIVDLRYRREPGTLFNQIGDVVGSIGKRDPVDVQMRVGRQGGSWVVLGLRTVEAGVSR